ncbi:UNVERIFIED_CONTAM: hypothetical protein Scaly_2818000 [Sesamum calycinum]|uniref:Uncharacterized protein n=1 Tax=Sesamum calycinum TaxID=2727403 RepID=A0AAW2IUI3_9LAMI
MAKLLLVLFALCVVPSIVTARFSNDPLLLTGCVYCDTCRCGYETSATKYLAVLVKSPDPECSVPNAGRDRARVILTRNNGMNSNARFANALGFLKNTPLASCPQVLQQYQEAED